MHAAHDQDWVVDLILGMIIFSYLLIAAQFFHEARKHPASPFKNALMQLMFIFIFCACCGYLPRLIYVSDWLLLAAHMVLLSCSWLYVVSRQIEILAAAPDKPEYKDPVL